MLTRIVHNSPRYAHFSTSWTSDLSKPQRQHMLNLMDGLLVCEDEKTLAALQRQFIEAPDASNLADFLRISPWQADGCAERSAHQQVQWALAQAERLDLAQGPLHQPGRLTGRERHGIPAIWNRSTGFTITPRAARPNRSSRTPFVIWKRPCASARWWSPSICDCTCAPKPCDGSIVTARPDNAFPFAPRTAWPCASWKICARCCPTGWTIYVQFDSWYASEQLIKYVRHQGWHVTCGLKHNRKLNGQRIDQLLPLSGTSGTPPCSGDRCGREQNRAIMCARPLGVWKRFPSMSASFSPNGTPGRHPRRTS